jgi:hypothetical protein
MSSGTIWRLAIVNAAVAALLTLAATTVAAQGTGGIISGTVKDAQGGVLPGVTVTIRNDASGVTRTAVTETDGIYRFPALNPGRYTVTAELSGFATVEVKAIEMTIGLGLTQDFTMQVQSLAETITVTGSAPVVDTTKSEVSGVVTQQQIETLPINSRQYLSLALLMPGTSVELFNAFNTTNLQAQYGGGRVTNALSDAFGLINTARPGRQAELAVRLLW